MFLFEISRGAIQHGVVHIANGDDANSFHTQAVEVVLTATVQSNNGDADVVVRADDPSFNVGGLGTGERGHEA